MATIDDVYNVVLEIREAVVSPPGRPEEIFTCAAGCGRPIIAYGDRGEAFVEVRGKYFHNNCAPVISEVA